MPSGSRNSSDRLPQGCVVGGNTTSPISAQPFVMLVDVVDSELDDHAAIVSGVGGAGAEPVHRALGRNRQLAERVAISANSGTQPLAGSAVTSS